jgi:hypothetical protein
MIKDNSYIIVILIDLKLEIKIIYNIEYNVNLGYAEFINFYLIIFHKI